MLKNYFKIAWRNLLRSKSFSIINISGLAIGMASAMLILLWAINEISYDRFYTKTDRIYKMYNRDNLGLFGRATYMAENRIKEIGVRKVLGASAVNIAFLLSKDFLKLIIISVLIASPVAYITMSKWLSNYQYRTEIQWWIFFSAGLLAIFIALVAVSSQAIKAALSNPVKSLRTE